MDVTILRLDDELDAGDELDTGDVYLYGGEASEDDHLWNFVLDYWNRFGYGFCS